MPRAGTRSGHFWAGLAVGAVAGAVVTLLLGGLRQSSCPPHTPATGEVAASSKARAKPERLHSLQPCEPAAHSVSGADRDASEVGGIAFDQLPERHSPLEMEPAADRVEEWSDIASEQLGRGVHLHSLDCSAPPCTLAVYVEPGDVVGTVSDESEWLVEGVRKAADVGLVDSIVHSRPDGSTWAFVWPNSARDGLDRAAFDQLTESVERRVESQLAAEERRLLEAAGWSDKDIESRLDTLRWW